MPDNNEIARDLTVIYLQNRYNKNVSDQDLVKKYKETYEKFEVILNPVSKVTFLDQNALFQR